MVDFDANGKVVWQLTNDGLPGPWLQDPCGGQVLPNGNFVIASYAGGRKDSRAPKLFEVNRDKKVVWTYSDGQKVGIHHFQILATNGIELSGPAIKCKSRSLLATRQVSFPADTSTVRVRCRSQVCRSVRKG